MSPSLTVSWSPTPSFDRNYFDGSGEQASWTGTADKSTSLGDVSEQDIRQHIAYFDGNSFEANWLGPVNGSASELVYYKGKFVRKHYGGIQDWSVSVESPSYYLGQGSAAVPEASFNLTATKDSLMMAQEDLVLNHTSYGSFAGSVDSPTVDHTSVAVSMTGALSRLTVEVNNAIKPIPWTDFSLGNNFPVTKSPVWNEWNFADYGFQLDVTMSNSMGYAITLGGVAASGKAAVAVFTATGALLKFHEFPASYGPLLGLSSEASDVISALFFFNGNPYIEYRSVSFEERGLDEDRFNNVPPFVDNSARLNMPSFVATPGMNALQFEDSHGDTTTYGYIYSAGTIYRFSRVYDPQNSFFSTPESWISTGTNVTAFTVNDRNQAYQHTLVARKVGTAAPEIRIYTSTTYRGNLYVDFNGFSGKILNFSKDQGVGGSNRIYFAQENSPYSRSISISGPSTAPVAYYGPPDEPIFASSIVLALGRSYVVSPGKMVRHNFGVSWNFTEELEQVVSTIKPFKGVIIAGQVGGSNLGNASASPGWIDTPWNKLNEFSAVTNFQISQVGDAVSIYNPYNSVFRGDTNLKNHKLVSLQANQSEAYRYIEVEYMNTSIWTTFVTMYDAFVENRTFSIEVAETKTETVDTNNFPYRILQPIRTATVTQANSAGYYFLIGSDNLPVQLDQFEAYGGSVTVSANPDTPGAIDIKMVGPSSAIPGVPAPYTIGISDGSTTRGAFSILANGITSDPKTLKLSTGVDWSKVSEESSGSALRNSYVSSLHNAYSVGLQAVPYYQGSIPELKVSIPYSDTSGFISTIGTRHEFMESMWTVVGVEFGEIEAQLTMVQTTTVGEVNARYSGLTVGQINEFWEGYKMKDMAVALLRSIEA